MPKSALPALKSSVRHLAATYSVRAIVEALAEVTHDYATAADNRHDKPERRHQGAIEQLLLHTERAIVRYQQGKGTP